MTRPLNSGLCGPLLQLFFVDHLQRHKRASEQTIASYRDTFRLLLRFMQGHTGIAPADLPLAAIDADAVLAFLDHVEHGRRCSVRSRNIRLAAIRSFFRYVSLRDPTCLGTITRIMAIPIKRFEKKLVGFLSREEVKALIAAPDVRTWSGRRDRALLLTLYNTGGRISEIIGLRRHQVSVDGRTGAYVNLLGKGRKERTVPLWDDTGRVLRSWLCENEGGPDTIVFPSARHQLLSRDGADYILSKAVVVASSTCSTLMNKKVSPHVLRHYVSFRTMSGPLCLA
jgi:integrase/recombinase XerD